MPETVLLFGDDPSVTECDDPASMGGNIRFVSHEHNRQPVFSIETLESGYNFQAGVRIESAGRLVCEQQRRIIDEGAGDGHPLLLSARKLCGGMVRAVGKADLVKERQGAAPALGRRHTGIEQRQLDIVQGGRSGQQIKALKDKAEFVAADGGPLARTEAADLDPVQPVPTGSRRVEATQQVHECRLARPRGSDHCNELTPVDRQADTVESPDEPAANAIAVAQSFNLDERHRLPQPKLGKAWCAIILQ
jgi:hypothetical protein